jgi:hypothetical protein
VYGEHETDKSDLNIEVIHFQNSSDLSFIPQGVTNFFTNIIGIFIERCGIKNLIGDELNEYSKLVWFALTYADVEYIPGNFFAKNLNLNFLWITDSKIKHIGENFFEPLQFLVWVDFLNNSCVNEIAFDDQITDLVEKIKVCCPAIDES